MTKFIKTQITENGEMAIIPCFVSQKSIKDFFSQSHCNLKKRKDGDNVIIERIAGVNEITCLREDELHEELGEFFSGKKIEVKKIN